MVEPVPIDVTMKAFQGIYTDIDPELLEPNILSFALNTQYVNKNKMTKRNGKTQKSWLGNSTEAFYYSATNLGGLRKPKILDWGKFQKRGGSNIYSVVLLQETQPNTPSDPTGFLYIEITNASTGALVSATLHGYNDGGSTRNQNPTTGKVGQEQDYIFIADGSSEKLFYINLTSSETTTAITTVTINSSTKASYNDSEIFNSFDFRADKLFVPGSSGYVYYSETFDLVDFAASDAGFIEYRSRSGLRAKEVKNSFKGLVVASENKDLEQYGADVMTGTVPFDITLPATDSRGFEVKELSSDISYIPGSVQNIDNNLIGLTPAGVVDLVTLISEQNDSIFGAQDQAINLEDTLSYPIDDYIRSFNLASSSIFSCHDPRRKRYYLSIPTTEEGETTKVIYVYDYKYKKGIPRWSIWKMKVGSITGLFTAGNRPYVADENGILYELESGTTDAGNAFAARLESAGVGTSSGSMEVNWESVGATVTANADTTKKYFNFFIIADEYVEVKDNYDNPKAEVILENVRKFPETFDRLYYFDRNRTFDDDGFGREIYFNERDLYRSRTARIVIEEKEDPDGNLTSGWDLKSITFKGEAVSGSLND